MPRPYTPTVGDRVVVVQECLLGVVPQRRQLTATVHYVRRRGDYQIETKSGARHWVDADGWPKYTDEFAGHVRVVGLYEGDVCSVTA